MNKVNCNVNTCSFNNNNCCYASRVNIGGIGATDDDDTCCGTFLDKSHYSDLTQQATTENGNTAVVCKVNTCKNYSNHLCMLQSINVDGTSEPKIYTETYCSSFESK